MQHDLNHQLNGITATLNVTLETTKKALKVAEEIKGKTTDIICDVSKVTNAADRLADTTQSFFFFFFFESISVRFRKHGPM